MANETSITLRDRIRSLQDASVLEPKNITLQIINDLGKNVNALQNALIEALPCYIRNIQAQTRTNVDIRPVRTANPSGKVAAIRNTYGRLDAIIPLADGSRKLLGDCVKADLLYYAQTLHQHAADTERKAVWFDDLAEKLPDDTTTVRNAALDLGERGMSKQILESKTNLPTATNELPSCSHTTSPSTAHAPINGREHPQLAGIHQETDARLQHDTGNNTSSTDHLASDTQISTVGAGTTSPDHSSIDTHATAVGGTDFDQSMRRSDSEEEATGQTTLDSGQAGSDTHASVAAVTSLANNHTFVDTRGLSVVGTHSQQTNNKALPNMCPSAAPLLEEPTSSDAIPKDETTVLPTLYDPALGILAQQLDDLEGLRKAQANRIRILTTVEPDSDGEMRGFGLPEDNPAVQTLNSLFDGIAALEHETVLSLQKAMRKHPLGAWQRSQKGVGEKTLARLLACIGDPYVRMDTNQPRTVSQLWAYCGLHTVPNPDFPADQGAGDTHTAAVGGDQLQPNQNVSARRRKGEQSNWSTNAKTRAYLISEALVKAGVRKDPDTGERYALNGSEYGQLYIDRRKHTAVTHPEWTPAHSQNDAMRILSKRLLRNLWRAARDIHKKEEETA